MSLKGNTTEEKIWNFLIEKIKNPYGVAGLMGNMYAESALQSNNLQQTYEKKLGFSDDSYTKAVDNGSYTNFIHDSAGYGLVQWTYWSLKEYLYNFAKKKGKSIGDLEMQLECVCQQLSEGYKTIWNTLLSATSVKEASNVVLLKFERPADQSVAVQNKRASYGQNYYDKYANKTTVKEETKVAKYSRQKVVDLVNSWLGYSESNGKHKIIVDIYNSFSGTLPRRTKMQYDWAWCACTWSALAVKLGYTAIMPIEISCYYLIENAKKMGCWVEKDGYVPKPGDAVLYDWDDGSSYASYDNTNSPDHVGTVVYVNANAGYFEVVEGNYSNSVKKRTVAINGRYIRGFITPKYDDNTVVTPTTPTTPTGEKKSVDTIAHEVIAGKWGNGDARKKALTNAGYDYNAVQNKVNEILNGSATKPATPTQDQNQPSTKKVTATEYAQKFDKSIAGSYKTTADLYCRNGAGTNKKALVIIPKGTVVKNYGYYSLFNSVKWFYIQFTIDGVQYTGFSSSAYLARA